MKLTRQPRFKQLMRVNDLLKKSGMPYGMKNDATAWWRNHFILNLDQDEQLKYFNKTTFKSPLQS